MRRLATLATVAIMVLALAAPATAGKPETTPREKTWVCHVTHSEKNPTVLVHVANGWQNGHDNGPDTGPDTRPAKHQNDDADMGDLPESQKAGPAEIDGCEPPPDDDGPR